VRAALHGPFISCCCCEPSPRLAEGSGESRGRQHSKRGARAVVVVILAPVLDQHLGFSQAGEQLHGEQVVAGARAEAVGVGFCRASQARYRRCQPARSDTNP
jgi:hypothetical protein